MKKIVLIIIVTLFSSSFSFAQENKAQQSFLPKKGDWAIGIDMFPVFKYLGNAFNGNADNELDYLGGTPFTKNDKRFSITPDVSIMGKYMLTDEWALRANLGLTIHSKYHRSYIQDDKAIAINPFSEDKLIDKAHEVRSGMSLALGGEYRKGSRRVQGVFGMGVLFAYQKNSITYSWANQMTEINQRPSTSFQNQGDYHYTGYRLIKDSDNGADFYTGVTGSVGVEWFMCPKISLGAEVNIVAYYLWGSQTYQETEGYNTSSGKVERRTDLISPGDREFYLGTESLGGSLNMTFYF